MQTAPNSHSTAKRTVTASIFKPRVRRLGLGRYLVESASRPGRGHTTTATSCSCIGFSYRKTCKHVALVQALAWIIHENIHRIGLAVDGGLAGS